MDLQQLRYVVAVAETRSFTRAAERCFVVQSALSHQIARLERELDLRLFARTSRRVELTPAGEAFLPGARECLEAAERAAVHAAAAVGVVRGRLSVGMIPTVAAVDVVAALKQFREAYPQVHVALRIGGSDEQIKAIHDGDLDVGFLGLPQEDRPQGVTAVELGRDRHVLVVPTDHPLAKRKRVTLAAIAGESFADFPDGSPGRIQSDRAFAAAGLTRDVAFEVMDLPVLVRLVAQGLAIALLPSLVVAGQDGLATVAVTNGPRRAEYMVSSQFNPTPATTAFLDIIQAR